MRFRFATSLFARALLVACVSLTSAHADEKDSPVLLARFNEDDSQVRTLFLYSSEELRAVYAWLGDSWVPARKERDASSEEPYYAYRVLSQLAPSDSRQVLVNSWTMPRDRTYRHELQIDTDVGEVGFRVTAKLLGVRSREQDLADQQLRLQPVTSSNEAAGFAVGPESQALIKAVRETGAKSVQGQLDPELVTMAQRYARRMARQRRQDGHAGWNQRFQTLIRQGGGGRPPSEITAESWSHLGPSLETHARSCVESWMQSPGHRADMMRFHGRHGYAMARGNNGVYYAVGIFAN